MKSSRFRLAFDFTLFFGWVQNRGLGAGGRNARDCNDEAPSERQRSGQATPMAPSVNASLSAAVGVGLTPSPGRDGEHPPSVGTRPAVPRWPAGPLNPRLRVSAEDV